MSSNDANEALAIIRRIGPVVLSAAVETSGGVGSTLRRLVGMMVADKNMTNISSFAIVLGHCLDLARACAATLVTMDRVRKAALAETPVSLQATQTVLTIVRMTLATEARIIAYMKFRSRDEVDQIAALVYQAFTQTSEAAADDLDAGTYMAITRLHGDVTLHLAERGRRLPRVINYSYQTVLPAYRMAQRAYANANRARDLINENKVVHPAFMPRDGRMLAV